MPVEVGYLGQCLGQLGLAHPPFLNEVVANHVFLSKVRPPIYATVHVVMLSKKPEEAALCKRWD